MTLVDVLRKPIWTAIIRHEKGVINRHRREYRERFPEKSALSDVAIMDSLGMGEYYDQYIRLKERYDRKYK